MPSDPFEPPRPIPEKIAPNRVDPKKARRSLGMWLALIVFFLAVHHVFSPDKPKPAPALVPASVEVVQPQMTWGWVIPAVVYGGMLVALLVLRAKLPPQMRKFELKTTQAEAVDEPVVNGVAESAEEKIAPVEVEGNDGTRPIRLVVDASGIHWHAVSTAFLHGPAELHAEWSEIESVRIDHGALFWTWTATFASIVYGFIWPSVAGFIGLGITLLVYLVERNRPMGTFSFVTPKHSLTFQSRKLNRQKHVQLVDIVRAFKPSIAPKNVDNPGAFRTLVVDPFLQFREAFSSDVDLELRIVRQTNVTIDPEKRIASRLQMRMFSLWSGTMRGVGPVAFGISAAIVNSNQLGFLLGFVVAWVVGLILVTSLLKPFARFSGLALKQSN